MESGYSSQRVRNMFSPASEKPFKLSRSRISNFLKCARCFYLDRKCGTDQPPMFPYTLNNAVDALLKKEFDVYRKLAQPHPLFLQNGIEAIPFDHPEIENWRMNQRGIQFLHEPTNFIITGAVDDVWITPEGELIIADYKATSTKNEITLNDRDSYKRQMEIYQWLFRKNGFKVSNTGYFYFCNADAGRDNFIGTLEFKISFLPYYGDDSWIEGVLRSIKECLSSDKIPQPSANCDYCQYWISVTKHVATNKS